MSNSESSGRGQRPPFHKRQYIIDLPFQKRLMGTMTSLWLANSVFFSIVTYFFYGQHLIRFYYLFPRPDTYPLVSVPALLVISVGFVSTFGLVVLLIVALYMSNQIAGPLYRTKESMARVGRGELGFRLQFRQGDFLRDIPVIFNAMMDGLRQQTETEIEELRMLEKGPEDVAELKRRIRTLREQKETRIGLTMNGEGPSVSEQDSAALAIH